MVSVLARATAKREKPQDIARSSFAFSPFVRSVGARVSVARRQLTTGISSEILCGADVVVVVVLVARVAAAAADDDDKAGCSYWVSLSPSRSLWLRERRRESRRGCGRAEGICSSQNSPLSSSAAAAAADGFFSSSSSPPLPPSLFSVGAVAGRLNALEPGRERETDGERNSERPFERRRPVHFELRA